MSVEYYYVNDLNRLYNAAVGDKTDGDEHHVRMMESHDNLDSYMQKLGHWKDTALQLSRNNGEAQAKIKALEADYVISNRELLVKQVEIARLTAELAELRERTRWIPRKEKMPEVDKRVEFFGGFEQTTYIGYYREHATQWESESGGFWHEKNFGFITHWRNLPEPPEATDD